MSVTVGNFTARSTACNKDGSIATYVQVLERIW